MSADGHYAVVLAAGAGSRFGGNKLAARWRGGTLLNAALCAADAAPVAGVVVVTGAHADAVEAIVAGFARTARAPVRTVRCADHAAGMTASLRCGLTALPAGAAGAFIFLGDMPRVPVSLPGRLLARVLAGATAAAPSFEGRLGHPVLISRTLFDAFSRQAGDGGGATILRNLGKALAVIAVDDGGVLADIDTQADLRSTAERQR